MIRRRLAAALRAERAAHEATKLELAKEYAARGADLKRMYADLEKARAELTTAISETNLALDQRDRANAELGAARAQIATLTDALFHATGGQMDLDALGPKEEA